MIEKGRPDNQTRIAPRSSKTLSQEEGRDLKEAMGTEGACGYSQASFDPHQ